MEFHFPILLDGATGTELQKRGYRGGISAEQWVLEHPDAIADATLADWEKVMAVNLRGPFLCTRAAFRIMKKQSGRVTVAADVDVRGLA